MPIVLGIAKKSHKLLLIDDLRRRNFGVFGTGYQGNGTQNRKAFRRICKVSQRIFRAWCAAAPECQVTSVSRYRRPHPFKFSVKRPGDSLSVTQAGSNEKAGKP
jgi:hypothetical protein